MFEILISSEVTLGKVGVDCNEPVLVVQEPPRMKSDRGVLASG
jgi:hypothetical protein